MKYNSKSLLTKSILVLSLGMLAFVTQNQFDIASISSHSQEAVLFGVGSDEFVPYVEKTAEQKVESRVKWFILIASFLLLVVLSFVFDIAAFAQKITGKKVANANKINAWLMLIFLVVGMFYAFWELIVHGPLTKVYNSSSAHGVDHDSMFMITFILTGIVFVITQILLFVYAFIYQAKEGRKATYYSHNNRLEVFWTIIPAIVLTFLVLRGYAVWKDVMYKTDKPEQVQEIEIFAYQFGWTARYPGADGKFGAHSFNYISGTNELGLAVKSQIEQLKLDLQEDIENAQQKLANQDAYINQLKEQIEAHKKTANFKGIKDANKEIAKVKGGEYQKELELMVRRRTKQLERMAITETDEKAIAKIFDGSVHDDFITKEVVVLKGKPVRLKFRARDVIHSAYLPDFRVQMNCVPGMETEFSFVPTKSTSEIREEKGDDKYDYYMFCNKICGQAHFNMKIKFTVVDSEADLNAWLVNQKPAFPVELPIRREVEEVEVAENLQFDKKEQTI